MPALAMSNFVAGANPRPHSQNRKRQRGYEIDDIEVRRKSVKGGRIKKNKKPRQHEPSGNDLFCEICKHFLWDGNSKASHYVSLAQLKRMYDNREEDEENHHRPTTPIVQTERLNADVMRKAVKEFANMQSNPNVSQGFKEWIVKSLTHAKRNNKQHLGAVQREIVYTYWHCNNTGILLTTTWDSMPTATGKRFIDGNPTILPEVVFTGSQVEKLSLLHQFVKMYQESRRRRR